MSTAKKRATDKWFTKSTQGQSTTPSKTSSTTGAKTDKWFTTGNKTTPSVSTPSATEKWFSRRSDTNDYYAYHNIGTGSATKPYKGSREEEDENNEKRLNLVQGIGANLENGLWRAGVVNPINYEASQAAYKVSSSDTDSWGGQSADRRALELAAKYYDRLKEIWGQNTGSEIEAAKDYARGTIDEIKAGNIGGALNNLATGGYLLAEGMKPKKEGTPLQEKLKDTVFATYDMATRQAEEGIGRKIFGTEAAYQGKNALFHAIKEYVLPNITGSKDNEENAKWIMEGANRLTGNMTDKVSSAAPALKYIDSDALQNSMNKSSKLTQIVGQAANSVGAMLPSIGLTWATKDPDVGLSAMAMSAAGDAAKEAYDAGATPEQAYYVGVEKGIVEYASEKMFDAAELFGGGALTSGVKEMLGDYASSKIGRVFGKVLEGLGENVEEAASDWAAPGIEKAVLGRTLNDEDDNTIMEALLGQAPWTEQGIITVLSTIMLQGLGAAGNAVGKNTTKISAQKAQDIVDYAKLTGDESLISLAEQYQQKINAGKSISVAQAERLDKKATQSLTDADVKNTVSAVLAKLQERGIDNQDLALAITVEALGNEARRVGAEAPKLTKEQKQLLNGNHMAKQILEDLNIENLRNEMYSDGFTYRDNEWVKDMKKNKLLAADVYGQNNDSVSADEIAAGIKLNGKSVKIDGMDGEKVRVKLGDEIKTVSADALEGLSDSYRELIQTAGESSNGNVMLKAYKAGQNVKLYTQAWSLAEDAFGAQQGWSLEQAKTVDFLRRNLTDEQLDMALSLGRERYEAMQKAAKEKAAMREADRNQAIAKGTETRKRGTVDVQVDETNLKRGQKKVLATVRACADAVNLNYRVVYGDPHDAGSYIEGGTVVVNLNAGEFIGKNIGAATLSHELTHYLQDFAPEEYNDLKDFIVEHILQKSPEQFQRLVKKQMQIQKDLTYDAAVDEMIANACQKMLLDSKAIEKLARQNMTLFEKVGDAIGTIAERIKAGFEDVDTNDDLSVYEAARAIEDWIDEVQKLWDKALIAADTNYNAVGKKISVGKGGREANYSYVGLPANSFYTNKAIYSYDFLTAQDDMVVVEMPPLDAIKEDGKVSRDKAVEEGMNNLAKVGEKNGDVYDVENKYTKRKISAGVNSLRHSLKGDKAHVLRTNARLDAIAGELIKNAIPINGLKKENEQALGTYAMMAIARSGKATFAVVITVDQFSNAESIEAFDVTHAINGRIKREDWSSNKDQPLGENSYGLPQSSTLTIAEVLDIVNETHRGILSKDVLDHFKEKRPKEGYYPGRVLFQMLSPVEQTDKLVAVHNKSVSGLRRMLQRGGVPFPSIAVKKAGTPHEGFGDVSIVFPRSTIDPEASRWNKLYSNDAWTPTEPATEYDVGDTWDLQKQFKKMLGEDIYSALQTGGYLQKTQLERDLGSSNGDVFNALKGRSFVKYAYLKSIGQEPKAGMRQARLDGFGKYKNDQLLAVFDALPADVLLNLEYDNTEAIQQIADVLNKQFISTLPANRSDLINTLLRKPLYTADKVNPYAVRDAFRKYQESGETIPMEIDDTEIDRALRDNKEIENDPEYKKWVENTFDGLIKDSGIPNGKGIYTDSGNPRSFKARHVPATLDNIVREMRKEEERGNGLFGINLRGAATKTYNTVEEMRAESGKLLGTHIADEVYDSYTKGFMERLHEMEERASLRQTLGSWDSTRETLLEAVRDAKTKKQMDAILRKNSQWIKYSEDLVDDLWDLRNDVQNMPAPYFEAKPRRIVYPSEALAYIVPDNADSDVMKELEERGYNVLTYKAGDEQDRLAKLNSVEGAKFQKLGISETAEEQQAKKESFDNLKAENRILRARAEYWKAQTRKTKERTVRQKDTDRLANELLKKYESRADKGEVKAALKELGDWLVQTEDLDYDTLKEKAEAIAEDIISGNYALLDNSQQEQLDRLKDYLKSNPVNLSASDWRDTGDEGFRKKYGRYFTVRENGRTIDSLWGEMAAIFGEGIFPEDVYAPGDMLNMIADYLDLWKPQYGNEFELYHGEAVDAATNDIIDAILSEDVRQTPATYADKAQQKLNAQIAKDKAKLDALREQKNARIEEIKRQAAEKNAQIRMGEKAAKYEAVSKVKQHYQDMISRQRNKRSDTAVRKKIKALHKELSDMLLKPKEGRYVPRELVKATADILGAIDTTSGRAVKAKAALAELKVKYDALAKDPKYALTYDETVSGMLQQIAEDLDDRSIYDLTGNTLEGVYNTLKALKYTIQTANRLVGAKIEADAFEAANQMMNETANAKGIPTMALRKFVMTQLTPSSVFRMFGGYKKGSMWEQMYDMLNQGQLTQTQILMEGGQIFRELIDDRKNLDKLHDKKNLIDIGLKDADGKAIKVTRGMMLSVYMHLLNEQNAKHVAYGGLTVPRIQQYYKNQMKEAFTGNTGRAVAFATEIAELNRQLAEAETAEEKAEIEEKLAELNDQTDAYMSNLRSTIEEKLTDYDRKWIAAAQKFFDEYSKNKLNEVTEMVYGFAKAQVDNYFPIHTDPNYRAASFDTIIRDMSLENAGFMKERINGANPILLEDITDVISSQLRRTAQYVGMMPAIRNFNKAYGKARAGYEMSVQSAMSGKFETEGKNYIENLMADLNGARRGEPNIFDALRGRMAGAVLTLNPRVAMSQTASFPSAAAEIGYRPLMKALTDMKNPMWDKGLQEEIAKWTPLWWYRMQGFSTAELGDIKSNEQAMKRFMDRFKWATGWIQAMDGYATGGLWQASKYYVDENFSDLEKGSEEYYMKVAETFNRVLEKTQPDYTTMQRPDILRNPNAIIKQLTMFMTQRLQNANILYDAAATYSHYVRDTDNGRNGVTAADVKQARTRLAWAVSSQVAAGATIVIFKAIADAIMHNLKGYRDDDDELTAESVSKTLLTNFIETLTGNILWGSEIFSWMKSALTGERYYGVSLNGVATFQDFLNDANKLAQKLFSGDIENARDPAWKLAKSVAQFFGAPLANGEKFYQMAVKHYEDAKNGEFLSYESDVDRTRAQNTRLLFNALQSGDTQKAAKIQAEFKDKADERSALKGYLKELYTDPNKGDSMRKNELITLLQKYCGMTKRAAEDTAQQWTMEVVTGIKYSDLQDEYIAGNISKGKAVRYYQNYSSNGHTTEAEAEEKVMEWTCEKETGIKYSDIPNEVKTGRLSAEKAIQMLMKYGGKSEDAATKMVNGYAIEHEYDIKPSELEDEYVAGNVTDEEALDILERYKYYGKENAEEKADEELERMQFVREYPDAEDMSITQVRNYNASGLDGYVSPSDYLQAAKMMGTFKGLDEDGNGKTDPYSVVMQKLEYIDSMDLDPERKTALALSLGINEKTIRRKAPWL